MRNCVSAALLLLALCVVVSCTKKPARVALPAFIASLESDLGISLDDNKILNYEVLNFLGDEPKGDAIVNYDATGQELNFKSEVDWLPCPTTYDEKKLEDSQCSMKMIFGVKYHYIVT